MPTIEEIADRNGGLPVQESWYATPSGGHELHGQWQVIQEGTGRTVAIVYDGARDAALTAAAPAMADALRRLLDRVAVYRPDDGWPQAMREAMADGRQILADLESTARESWSAGWNMPGCLPDEPAEHFTSWDEARAYLVEELERAADDYGDASPETGERGEGAAVYETALGELRTATADEPMSLTVGAYAWWIQRA